MKTMQCLLFIVCVSLAPATVAETARQPDRAGWPEAMVAARAAYLQSAASRPKATSAPAFQPVDSGLLAGTDAAQKIVVDVTGLHQLRLVTICEKSPGNCNIWGEPRLIAPDGSVTKLTELQPSSIKVGWGQMLVDKNWQDHPLIVGDRQFEFGVWVHADSELIFDLGGRYERFESFVGEDIDRAVGAVRFMVLSAPTPLPPCWPELAGDYPSESCQLQSDAGRDRLAFWFEDRESSGLEQELIARVLYDIASDSPLHQELKALTESAVGAGDVQWLDLYERACCYRNCMTTLRGVANTEGRSAFEQELWALLAAKTPPDDVRWNQLRSRALQVAELDDQYAALQYDIQQRAVLGQPVAERIWNGTCYVPAHSSTAEEIASQAFHNAALILASDRDPADVVLRRTQALLADLKKWSAEDLDRFDIPLDSLQQAVANTPVTDSPARRALHHEICQVRRQIAFANPLLCFQDIVFVKRHRAFYQHMCDQFYGICQNPGGGLYVLHDAFGATPQVRDLLSESVCVGGRLQGQRLSGGSVQRPQLSYDGERAVTGDDFTGGSFLSPALSPDGKQIAFAYVEREGSREQVYHEDPTRGHWDVQRCYHIFTVNVDGTDLRQLTDGTWNDFDPCWLPNGRIAFISERRGGYLRCGRACPLYTLYDMNADGSGINCLSFHDSNEWNPSVSHDGRIVWTRWDYVDRHGCIAHMPWITTLDGRDPRPLHGNYAPRQGRPDMELFVRAIPGSQKYVGLAAPHHGQAYGSIVIINPQVTDDDGMGPVRRFTPDVGFPESQGGREVYSTPWPLAENYHLCVYDAAMNGVPLPRGGERYGIYLVDAFGNKELLYRDPDIGCMNPIPLRAQPLPPAPADNLVEVPTQGGIQPGAEGEGTMAVMNVYDYQRGWPEGTTIASLRILQLLPCAVPSGGPRPHETGRRIAEAGDSLVPCRWVLGTVPVEADGSAHFTVPAYRELFFQALDERGMALTSMRSATHVRAGETLMCQGCHENKSQASPPPSALPLALRRPPSVPQSDVDGSNPFSYPRLVQTMLDRNCVQCHEENKDKQAPNLGREPIAGKFYASYNTLVNYGFTSYGDSYRTLPGQFGARGSKLIEMLEKGHHDVKLTDEDLHRLTLWLDCCSMFYGVFEKEPGEAQLRGEVAHAILE